MAGRILLDVLVKRGFVGREKLLFAMEPHAGVTEYYLRLDDFCRENGHAQGLAGVITEITGVPIIAISEIDTACWLENPLDCWEKHMALPYRKSDGGICLAMVNPFDAAALQSAEIALGSSLQRAVIDVRSLSGFFSVSGYTARSDYRQAVRDVRQEYHLASPLAGGSIDTSNRMPAAIEDMICSMISKAVEVSASDIHIDALADSAIIRFRIDRCLYLHTEIPTDLKTSLLMNLLLRSGLDITCHACPQDGSFQIVAGSNVVDIRVAVMPTVYGLRLCMRLLGGDRNKLNLSEIGMGERMAGMYRSTLLRKPGLIVVAGPTNSGKTTTMHAGLSEFDHDSLSIFTLEDPVESRLWGITQIQVNEKQGFSYAVALRHLLRHDPDIVMIGEVRDKETAMLTVRAALAGHHVICSIHAKDSAAAVARLTDMGVEPYLLGECLNAVIAQRLARKICNVCNKAGCPTCLHSGYRNLTGVFEYLQVDAALSSLIASGASADAIRAYMKENAMPDLRQDAMLKVENGMTDVEEMSRILEI